jgi:hypothetical protein
MSPNQKSLERANALQKYLMLHSQREALEAALNNNASSCVIAPPSPSCARSRGTSLSSISELEAVYPSLTAPVESKQLRHCTIIPDEPHVRSEPAENVSSLLGVIHDNVRSEDKEKEDELNNINKEIKSTLTNLLNCDGVKDDRRYRSWVQTRLMDIEKELLEFRRQSCKMRSVSVDNAVA